MMSLSNATQNNIIEASRYFDDLLIIDNPYFEVMVFQLYPTESQLYKANSTQSINKRSRAAASNSGYAETNSTDTEPAFSDLHLLISNDFVSSKNYD